MRFHLELSLYNFSYYSSSNVTRGLPQWLSSKESACNAGDKETPVPSLGQEDLLDEEMVTHSSDLAQKIPRTEEFSRVQSTGLQKSQTRLSH